MSLNPSLLLLDSILAGIAFTETDLQSFLAQNVREGLHLRLQAGPEDTDNAFGEAIRRRRDTATLSPLKRLNL